MELGPLEMRILGLLSISTPQSVAEIKEKLAAEGTTLAYTTVMTVMRRLFDKGLVSRVKDARRHLYAANKTAPEIKQSLVSRIHRALFRQDRLGPVLALVQEEDISKAELEALRKAIDQRLKGGRR